ncbi:DUF2156 domain-containing protein [Litoribrevibacter albus]|uniref:Phosphatidylglycerol lysyltransferase C-terminal domain-containing protein n=1 Tax=Litoribrevibacter albus TaxID=1473156 RepID=A0AA37SF12_9GAMM|nr:DUF2156 domain-containing protein [Litoribrevibacter albus]GLQ32809.1 hypothetical protein GCM10007876_32880 [Litoribrevibacter albus]
METLLKERLGTPNEQPKPSNSTRVSSENMQATTPLSLAKVLQFPESLRWEDHEFTLSERVQWLERFGNHCMSYSTLQPKMQYFDLPGVGFIAYRDCFGERIVLSDPICAPHLRVLLISEFLRRSPKRTSFVQITPPVAQILAQQFQMFTTEFGQETTIELNDWSLRGKKKQIFRTALNQAEKMNISIMETFSHHLEDRISETWLNTRRCKNNEINFLIRPKTMPYQKDVRRFYGYKDLQPIGFIHFDPIYQHGKIIGYVPNISRANHMFKQGLFYAIMAVALEQFKQEGLKIVNLGLSPLHLKNDIEETQTWKLTPSTALTRLFKLTHRFGQRFYNFQGIQFTKQRFRATEQTTFVASRQKVPLKAFLACFRLSNLL